MRNQELLLGQSLDVGSLDRRKAYMYRFLTDLAEVRKNTVEFVQGGVFQHQLALTSGGMLDGHGRT